MGGPSAVSPPRRLHPERGAAFVEFAILGVLLLTLLFGVIDYGTHFHRQAAQRNGTDQAARAAAVGDFGGCTAVDATAKIVCNAKDLMNMDADDLRIHVELVGPYEAGSALLVCSERRQVSVTGFFSPFLDGYSRAIAYTRIEDPNPTEEPSTGGDTAFSGDWAWCA
jgi:hypothetical protein